MADQHDLAAAAVMDLRLAMHLGDQRTGGVEREQLRRAGLRRHRSAARRGRRRSPARRCRGSRPVPRRTSAPLARSLFDHVAVMHDLVTHIDRRPVDLERPLHDRWPAPRRRRSRAGSTEAPAAAVWAAGSKLRQNQRIFSGSDMLRLPSIRPCQCHCAHRGPALIFRPLSVIADDVLLRPQGRAKHRGDLPMANAPLDAESNRRLAGGQYRAVLRPDRRFLQACTRSR